MIAVVAVGGGCPVTSDGGYKAFPEPQLCRPPRSESRARSQLINLRVNEDERERWTAFAQSKGMSLGGLLRLSVESALLQEQMCGGDR